LASPPHFQDLSFDPTGRQPTLGCRFLWLNPPRSPTDQLWSYASELSPRNAKHEISANNFHLCQKSE
jgi:hypothetical protein